MNAHSSFASANSSLAEHWRLQSSAGEVPTGFSLRRTHALSLSPRTQGVPGLGEGFCVRQKVALADGLYFYEPKNHSLKKIHGKDIRELTGKQPFVKDAPVNIILVADYSRTKKVEQEADKKFYAAADAGFISQNIYLYCASEGLATIVRHYIDKPALAAAMQLRPDQEVIFAQTVGYPKK